MESTLPIDDEGGLLDMADLDPDLTAPVGWDPEKDESEFGAFDRDDDPNG